MASKWSRNIIRNHKMQYAMQTGKSRTHVETTRRPTLTTSMYLPRTTTTRYTKRNNEMLSASQWNEQQAIKCEERIARSLPHAYNTCSDQSHPLIQTPGISKTLNHTCNPLTPRTCRWEREPEVRSEAAPPGTVRSAGAEGGEGLLGSGSDREGREQRDGAGRGMSRLSPSGSRGARRRGGRRRGRAWRQRRRGRRGGEGGQGGGRRRRGSPWTGVERDDPAEAGGEVPP
jgi:hypothetical protein